MGTHACNPSIPETAEFKEQKENRHITIWLTKHETAAFFPSKVMPGGGPKYQSPNHNLWLERTVRAVHVCFEVHTNPLHQKQDFNVDFDLIPFLIHMAVFILLSTPITTSMKIKYDF